MALFTFWSGLDHIYLTDMNGLSVTKVSETPILASLMNTDESSIQKRFSDGHEAWVAKWNGTPVSFGWVSRGRVRIGELSREIDIPKGNAYLWNFRTLEYYRGLGYYPQLLSKILAEEGKISDRLWIISAPENQPSSNGIVKAGFTSVGNLVFNYRDEVVLSVTSVDERAMAGASLLNVPITIDPTRPCWRCASSTMKKETSCDCYEQKLPCRCGHKDKPGVRSLITQSHKSNYEK